MNTPPAGPRLENRLPPDNLLDRDEHPLRELAWLLGASLVVLALLVLLTGWAARWLAPRLPFTLEVALAERVVDGPPPIDRATRDRQAALQALADRVAAVMALPPGMVVVVSDDPSPLVNAYATLGGRIRVHHGLLRRLDSEPALAALLAHEIAHVKHRHVAAGLGHGAALAVLLSAISPDGAARAAQGLLGDLAGLGLLGYSREAERQADAEALAASLALYGHGGGLVTLFTRLGEAVPQPGGPAWLRSHPETAERLARLHALAAERGAPMAGPSSLTAPVLRSLPLPPVGR